MDVSIIEKDLKNNSRNSTEDFLKYIFIRNESADRGLFFSY